MSDLILAAIACILALVSLGSIAVLIVACHVVDVMTKE